MKIIRTFLNELFLFSLPLLVLLSCGDLRYSELNIESDHSQMTFSDARNTHVNPEPDDNRVAAGGFETGEMSNQVQFPRDGVSDGKGMVVAGKPEAVAAGTEILEAGGNATDAAVSALLVLSVKHVGAFCIGGESPMLIYNAAKDEVKALSGQGAAPLDPEANEWYLSNGIPGRSIKAAAVPSVIDLAVTALQNYGTISFEEAVSATLDILDEGGPSWYYDTGLGDTIETGRDWYTDLAVTLRKLVEAEQMAVGDRVDKLQAASNRFYRGDIADALDAWYREEDGFLRKQDLIAHVTRIEDPVKLEYRGYTVYKVGPWSQGPFLLQALNLLKGFDLREMGHYSADYIHVVTEAMKLAFADRDAHYGDPRFSSIPMEALLSDDYSNIRRPIINMEEASREILPGDPEEMKALSSASTPYTEDGGTTTLVVSDSQGNLVVLTPSGLSSEAGSGGETGVIHGARLTTLNTVKGHPNMIEPGKRPRTTLTPTLVLKDGKPVIAISVAGGDLQDQAALQLLLNHIDFGMQDEEVNDAPRFATRHHTGSFGYSSPNIASLRLQSPVPDEVVSDLENRGHEIQVRRGGVGGVALIFVDPETKRMFGSGSAVGSIE
ncbi:MAG: gamma-glutamyltransferase [Balneolales bacterium]